MKHLRLVAAPPAEPCTCGGNDICTACVLRDLGFETAATLTALDRVERAFGDNRLHSVHVDHRNDER